MCEVSLAEFTLTANLNRGNYHVKIVVITGCYSLRASYGTVAVVVKQRSDEQPDYDKVMTLNIVSFAAKQQSSATYCVARV